MELEQIQALIAQRSDSPLFARLAAIYLEQGNIADAKKLCLTGVANYPSYATGHKVLAQCYAAESQFEEAITTIKQARKLFPDVITLVNLQREWEEKKAKVPQPPPPSSVEEIEEPPPISSTGEIVSQTLAEIYVKQGLIEQAIAAYQQLKQRKPAQGAEFDKRIGELEKKLGKTLVG